MISLREQTDRAVRQPGPQRPSWCYGTPGLARAQQLAALVLAERMRQRRAENALAGCLADETQLGQLGDPSLCHGWAGLFYTTWRMAIDAGTDSELATLVPHLTNRWEQHRPRQQPTTDGMLVGATGAALTQQLIDTGNPPATHWDACLLLTG